jgi:hypothetical protein
MTNSEQVAYQAMLRDCENASILAEQSFYKMIEVLFCETVLDVWLELFSHDDEPTFDILRAEKDGVCILHIVDSLGGLSKLSEAVEQVLKGGGE